MGRFENLTKGAEKSIAIGNETFIIKPLTGKHIGIFAELQKDLQGEGIKKLVYESLYMADKSITMSDVEELPFGVMTDILEVVMEVNGFNDRKDTKAGNSE